MRRLLFVWVFTTVVAAAHGAPAAFQEVDALFASGDFDAAARRVNDLLVRDFDLTSAERTALFVMKARLELAFERPGEARFWLAKAKAEQPDLALDPIKDPPELRRALEATDVAMEAGPAKDAGAVKSGSSPVSVPESSAAEKGGVAYRMLSYMPFGVAQAKNHEPTKALATAALHTGLLASAALAPEQPARRAALGVFLVVWGYSMVDGVGHHRELALGPAPGRGLAAAITVRF